MKKKLGLLMFVTGLLVAGIGAVSAFAQQETPAAADDTVIVDETSATPAGGISLGMALAIMGAALSAFGGALGSSIGVGVAGEVGNAVLSEDEKKFGSVLILQALPRDAVHLRNATSRSSSW